MNEYGRKYQLNEWVGTKYVGTIIEKYKNANNETVTVFINSRGFITELALANDEFVDDSGKVCSQI